MKGQRVGAGQGRGQGRGAGAGGGGRGAGRGQGGGGMGADGSCICPKCGGRAPHRQGVPCLQERCPDCGVAMVREGSPHHQEIVSRRGNADGVKKED
jgi:hypothetical protein